jgi:uncharacterized protein YkwD
MRCIPLLAAALALQAQAPELPRPSALERAVVQELSDMRWRPKVYVKYFRELRPYYEGRILRLPERMAIKTEEGVKALDEAIAFLESVEPAGPLRWNDGLWRAARELAFEQAGSGGTGHVGSRGSRMRERLDRQGTLGSAAGECIYYGTEDARMIAIQLVVDDGVPDRGHRRTIFSFDLHQAGAALAPHPQWGQVCVIDFADGFTPTRK